MPYNQSTLEKEHFKEIIKSPKLMIFTSMMSGCKHLTTSAYVYVGTILTNILIAKHFFMYL